MSADDDINACGTEIGFDIPDVVNDAQNFSFNVQIQNLGDVPRPRCRIVVASDGCHRCNGLQRIEHFRIADIAGMDDQLDTFQGSESFRSN